jgi:hypothetical protein
VASPKEDLVQALCLHYPQTSESGLKARLQQIVAAAKDHGLSEAEIDRQIGSWNIQLPRRRRDWVSADVALADLRRLLLGPQTLWAAIWRWLRRIAGVAFDHYVAVAGTVAALGGAFYGLAYARFYDSLDITPEQAGFSPSQILAHSVIGGVVLVALITLTLFCFFLPLVPIMDREAAAGGSPKWSLFFVNVGFALAGLGVLFGLSAMANIEVDLIVPIAAMSLMFLVFGSLDFGWGGWHPTVSPLPLEVTLERYVVVMIACAIPALLLTGWATYLEAKELGEQASVGKAVRDPKIGVFPFLGVRAEPALVSRKPSDGVVAVPHCVLYLGSSGGTMILYDHRSSSTFHVPEGEVSIQLKSEMSSCEAPENFRLPKTLPYGKGRIRCEHGGWHSKLEPHFDYEWVLNGHHLADDGKGSPWLLYERGFPRESVVYCRVWARTALGEDAAVSPPAIVGD